MRRRARLGLPAVVALGSVLAGLAGCEAPVPDVSKGGRIHVAAIQLSPLEGDLTANQKHVEQLIGEAARRGARYILLPEYFPSQILNEPGMTLDQVRARAEALDGPITTRLVRLCRRLGVYVAFPLAERRADGSVFNSTVYAGPRGIEGVYSKSVLISMRVWLKPGTPRVWDEDEIYAPGRTDGLITWGGVRVGALICADGGFPANYWTRVAKGAQLITHASASPGVKRRDTNPMPDAAARRWHRPVVFANQRWDHRASYGNTQICDAEGNVLAHAGRASNAVIDAVVEVPPVPDAPAP